LISFDKLIDIYERFIIDQNLPNLGCAREQLEGNGYYKDLTEHQIKWLTKFSKVWDYAEDKMIFDFSNRR